MQLKRFNLPPVWFGDDLCKVQLVSVSQLSVYGIEILHTKKCEEHIQASCLHSDSAVCTHRAYTDSIISSDLQPGFGENSRLPPTKLSNILECNSQGKKKKSVFVGSQVLAPQIIHDHRSY